MQCDVCGENTATVYVKQVIDGKVRELHLCESCAEEGGVNVENISLPDLLLGMETPRETESAEPDRSCPHCHMRRSDFKKTSRLGCPACYETFAAELKPLLASMHRGERHEGKVPSRAAGTSSPELAALQKELDAAVKEERFEEAAKLRDRIRALGPPPGDAAPAAGDKAAP